MYQTRNWTSGKPLNFRLHNTRGMEADQGIDVQEMCFILDGHIPDRQQVVQFFLSKQYLTRIIFGLKR